MKRLRVVDQYSRAVAFSSPFKERSQGATLAWQLPLNKQVSWFSMAEEEHVERLRLGGAAQWNSWVRSIEELGIAVEIDLSNADLQKLSLVGADLRNANLSESRLTGCFLNDANLINANLTGADLDAANLIHANLSYAQLIGVSAKRAVFRQANLTQADLRHADLTESNLMWATFSKTRLDECNFLRANCWETFFAADLRNCLGLDTINHAGASHVSIGCLTESLGQIPESFLRGAGVPESFITNMKSLIAAMDPIQFYSCFISYSTNDLDLARRLRADLQENAVRVWFAPEDLKIGDKFHDRIEASIQVHDKLLLVLSQHSIESDWVETEVKAALEREAREKRQVLFPIRIDDAIMDSKKAWAADIRRKQHIGDLTRWKEHDHYKKGFDRLLRDLQASAT